MAVTRGAFVWTSVSASVCPLKPLKAFASSQASWAACFAWGPGGCAAKHLKAFDSSWHVWGSTIVEIPGTFAIPPLKAVPPLKAFDSSCHVWGLKIAEIPGTFAIPPLKAVPPLKALVSSCRATWGSIVAGRPGMIASGGAGTRASCCSSAQAPWVWASYYSGGP